MSLHHYRREHRSKALVESLPCEAISVLALPVGMLNPGPRSLQNLTVCLFVECRSLGISLPRMVPGRKEGTVLPKER